MPDLDYNSMYDSTPVRLFASTAFIICHSSFGAGVPVINARKDPFRKRAYRPLLSLSLDEPRSRTRISGLSNSLRTKKNHPLHLSWYSSLVLWSGLLFSTTNEQCRF